MRYAVTTLYGLALFLAQVWANVERSIGSSTPFIKGLISSQLSTLDTVRAALSLSYYFIAGAAAHVLPHVLAVHVILTLRRSSHGNIRALASKPGVPAAAVLATSFAILFTNYLLFPSSDSLGFSLIAEQNASIALYLGIITSFAIASGYFILSAPRAHQQLTAIFAIGLLAIYLSGYTSNSSDVRESRRDRPDIIILGIDSLRPDHLRSFGYPAKSLAPFTESLIADAITFTSAYTPLARTFVSYTSILTGQYPTQHNARENLYPINLINTEGSIALSAKANGYEALLAMDEARFATFDSGFGFDHIVTPPPGLLDFVTTTLFDTAATNLLLPLPFSEIFYPHLAGNRGASTSYRPEIHHRKIKFAISRMDSDRPWLIVSHFTLAHWPYAPTSLAPESPSSSDETPRAYRTALSIADKQVKQLMQELKDLGRLQNAIVVLLSDHGEAFGLPGDRLHISGGSFTPTDSYYGHGKPALDSAQSHVLLAVLRMRDGKPAWSAHQVSQNVSLVDVAPTLLELAGMPDQTHRDGVSLLTKDGEVVTPESRLIFLESGLSGSSLNSGEINISSVVKEFGQLYSLSAGLRLQLSESEIEPQLRSKQRAVIFGNTGLSSIPGPNKDLDCWLVLDVATKSGACVRKDSLGSEIEPLATSLCSHFSKDKQFHRDWC